MVFISTVLLILAQLLGLVSSSSEPCCSLENGEKGFHWSSPGFSAGKSYPNKFRCTVAAATEVPHQTVYRLTSFELQNKKKVRGNKKCVDAVVIDQPYGKQLSLCGKQKGVIKVPNFRFNNRFLTDKKKNNNGFNITIAAVKTSCHEMIDLRIGNKTTGVITTPKYPNKFPKKTQCEWWVKAPIGQRIKLNIQRLSIKKTKGCSDAYMIVNTYGDRTYPPDTSRLMCGGEKNVIIRSIDDEINIVFDGGKKRSMGLKATYEVI